MLKSSKRSQALVRLITFFFGFTMFIFAAPIIGGVIDSVVSGFGTATAFVVKSFLWIILLVFVAVFLRIITSGEGFLA